MFIPRKSYASAGIGSLTSRLTGAGLEPKAAKAIGDVLGQILRQQNFDERLNYEAIERGSGSAPSNEFDCFVDPVNGTDNTILTNITFKTIHFALNTMFARNGASSLCRIGCVARRSAGAAVAITETVDNAAGNQMASVSIRAIGVGPIPNGSVGPEVGLGYVPWNMGGLTTTGGVANYFEGLAINTGIKASVCTGTVTAVHCAIQSVGTPSINLIWAEYCYLYRLLITAGASGLRDCVITVAGGSVWGVASFTAVGCLFVPIGGGTTLTFNAGNSPTFSFFGCGTSQDTFNTGSNANSHVTFSFTGTGYTLYWQGARMMGAGSTPYSQNPTVSCTGTPHIVVITGQVNSLTIGAAPQDASIDSPHYVNVTATTTVDITGPVVGHIGAAQAMTLRGRAINVQISTNGYVGAGVFLNCIGVTHSHITAAGKRSPVFAALTDKAYALDAASNDNILDFAGAVTGWAVASTNLGAGNIIRTT